MKTLGNIIWLLLGGIIASLGWFLAGILFSITIIGLPIGRQLFKLSRLMLTPFGKDVDLDVGKHPILNIIWAILVGWGMAVTYIGFAVLSAITIIGIPFAFQWLKLTKLALFPFGAKIVK